MSSVSRQLRSLLQQQGVLAWVRGPAAGMFAVGVAVIVWTHVHGGAWGFAEEQVELAGLVIVCLGWLIYIWARRAADTRALRQLHINGSQLRLLASQAPADVWTTDAELRLTSVLGALPARLEAPAARVPGRTLYDLFQTRDAAHPVIAAHLRALRGEAATYERVSGDLVLEGRVDPLRDGQGRVVGCVGVAVDVTARRQAEQQVRFLGTIAEQTADAIIVTDTDYRIVYSNASAQGLFGYSAEEFLGRTPEMLNAEPDAPAIQNQIYKDVASGNSYLGTLRNRRKDGTTFVCEFKVSPMRDAAGRVSGYIGVQRDVSERVRAAEQVERLASFPGMNPMPIVEMDAAGRISFMNPAAERLFPELRAVSPIHPFVADAWTLVGEAQCEGTVSCSREVRVGERWYLQDMYGLPDHSHLRIYASDITERKHTEELRERLAVLVESSEDAIVSATTDGTILTWNRAAEGLFGWSAQEAIGKPISIVFPPERAEEMRRNIRSYSRGQAVGPYETERVRSDGRVISVAVSLSPIKDGSGRVVGASGTVRDITERKRAVEDLRRSQERFELAALATNEAIWEQDFATQQVWWSRAFQGLFGYAPGEVRVAVDWWRDRIHPDDRERVVVGSQRVVDGGGRYWADEYRFRRADGCYATVNDRGYVVRNEAGKPVRMIGSLIDVTERNRTEEALRRSQTELRALARRLQSVREDEHTLMAREIHDELGQALTALRLDLSWLARKFPEASAAVRQKIGAMVVLTDGTIEAGRRIVAELRPPILDDLGLAPSLEWYVQQFAKRAGLRCKWDPGPADLAVDRELAVIAYRIVQEALTNVARHAQAKHVAVRLGEKDGALTVEIRDDGRGIPEDAVTSPRSLGIVGMRERALVRGGSLAVCRLPGGGTSVRVAIPIERRREPRESA